jgi:outer membrane protein TolC
MADEPAGHPFHPLRAAEASHTRAFLAEALALQAAEARNQAGGTALQVFYRLAQARAQAQVLRHSLGVVEAARSAAREQLRRGLPARVELQSLERQQLELRDRGEELARGIDRLSVQLDDLLVAGPPDVGRPIWPLMSWEIGTPPDPEAAAGIALAQRPRLILLRRLIAELDGSLRPLARALLGVVDPLLSLDPEPISMPTVLALLGEPGRADEEAEVATLRAQLHQLLAWRERTVAEEARAAALDVESATRRIALARELYLARRDEVDRLRARAGRGLTSSVEIHLAKLEVDKAQAGWIERVVEWHLSMARLEQSQGVLPARCEVAPESGGPAGATIPACRPPR